MLGLPPMNAIFFGLKRAYHGTLRIARATLAAMGLTAARFDLLFALLEGERECECGTLQSDLRRELGVSRPTVSRMLSSLETLGLVRRERSPYDRRQVSVELTRRGRLLIARAHRRMTRSGQAQLAVDCALGASPLSNRWYDAAYCFRAMATLEGLLRKIRDAFGDFATLHYRWHPDD
jgi:DNA-binding MarR family transcriptional regulator